MASLQPLDAGQYARAPAHTQPTPCLHDIVQRLGELAPDATPAAAAQLRPAAKQLLRGPGHAVKHLLQQTAPDAAWLRAAVLEYLATSEHCCDRVQVDAMLDAGVAELLAASMHAEPGDEAHLARQACRLLAAMAYQLASAAPWDEEESLVAQRMFQDATVAALVAYMRRHVADSTQFTMALSAAMKGVRDSEVAGRFNRHGLVAALEAALAHSRAHSDGAAEVRVLRFTWQFLGAQTVRAVVPLRTLTQALVYALPRTAAGAWMPSDYARLMVLTRTMRWTRCFAPKTLRTLRSLCVSVLTHTVTADNVLGSFCCLYLFSVLCMLKTPECALEGAGMPGHGLVAEVLDETCSVKQCIFWSQTLECYRAWLKLPVLAAPACEEQDGIVVQFLRQQCLGDLLSNYVEPGVCTPGACEQLLHCCTGFVSEAAPTHTVLLLHKLHLAMVCVQRGLSPPSVVLAALGVVRACAGLAAAAQHYEVSTSLLLEIVVNIDPEHLRQAHIGRTALDCLDCLVRGGGKVHVLQGPNAASLHTCVERDLYVLLDREQASMILRFFAQNLLQLAACKTDAVFAALVCHAIRAPEDIALVVTHGLNVACIIEFFSVKVTEGCTFFGVWLLAGLLGACVEKHVPVPPELDSLLCSIGPRGFARALDKLEAAAVAGRTITPLAFSLYFWHLLVSAVDEVFDEQARRALDATAVRCGTGVSKRFADLLVGALESRAEERRKLQAVALKKADALLEELVREEQAGAGKTTNKAKRSRRQRRAAQSQAPTQAAARPDAGTDARPQTQAAARPDAGTDARPQTQAEEQPCTQTDAQPQTPSVVQPEADAEAFPVETVDECVPDAQVGARASTVFSECAGCLELMDVRQKVMFVPCAHVSMCYTCAEQLQTCPMCRADVQMVLKPFYC